MDETYKDYPLVKLNESVLDWLHEILGDGVEVEKHYWRGRADVYKVSHDRRGYFLKVAKSLSNESLTTKALEGTDLVPSVVGFSRIGGFDHLLITQIIGKSLFEMISNFSGEEIAKKFAYAVRMFHSIPPEKTTLSHVNGGVLTHGDMGLPNILYVSDTLSGYIDVGEASIGSPEKDLADAIWSLQRNIGPEYGEYFLKQYGPYDRTKKIEEALAFRYAPPPGSA